MLPHKESQDPIDVATENIEQQIDMADGVNDPTNDKMGSAKTPSSEDEERRRLMEEADREGKAFSRRSPRHFS